MPHCGCREEEKKKKKKKEGTPSKRIAFSLKGREGRKGGGKMLL